MKITCLGAGVWGFCLARLLATKGHTVTLWAKEEKEIRTIDQTKTHPRLPGRPIGTNVRCIADLAAAIHDVDLLVEAVTSSGVRQVFQQMKITVGIPKVPIVIASKGIEQNSGLILPEVVLAVAGEEYRPFITLLSGPSFANEVSKDLPTAVVCGNYEAQTALQVVEAFSTVAFRVYPNSDIKGVAFGGALKNIIAIACGICDGLGLGTGAKAALMTRGLHEMVRFARSQGCLIETLYGLSGMGDLFLTSSEQSRNYRFGKLLSQGFTADQAKKEIGMVVEGAYTCIAALQIAHLTIALPITEAVHEIIAGRLAPQSAVELLMQRTIKEERL